MLPGIERTIPNKPWMKGYTFTLVQSIDQLNKLIDEAIELGECAFDLESTGLDTRVFQGKSMSTVVGYSIAFKDKECYYIPVRHSVETSRGKNLPLKETNQSIQRLINNCVIIGHNWLKFDAEMMLASDGITIKKVKAGEVYPYHDTYMLARLAGKMPAGLKYLSKVLCGKEMLEIKEIVLNKRDVDFGSVSPFEGCTYAASDAICTWEVWKHPEIQQPLLEQSFIYTLERKLMHVVRKMERNKIKLNVDQAKYLDDMLTGDIEAHEQAIFKMVADFTNNQITEFKIDSPADISNIFFNVYDMEPKPEKGKNGNYKTDDATLETLVKQHPLAKSLQEYRTLTKFHRTYIRNMIINVDKDGYLKFNFQPLRTDSGRFASPGGGKNNDGYSGVNIQAIPARYDKSKPNVRKCISCEDDEVFCALDWAGVEIRVAANMSLEPIWMDRFLKGDGDLHTSTASIIYDKAEHEVGKEERQTGKTFNFQSIYGGGPGALAMTIGIDIDDAKEKQQRFFGVLKTLKAWIKGLQKQARKNKYCLTRFGRKRQLLEYDSEFPRVRAGADRKAVNTPVQGSAADLLKIAMVRINDYIEENKLDDKIKMIVTMHDELCFRIKKKDIDLIQDIEREMRLDSLLKKIGWKVPLKVDVEVGASWDIDYEYPDMLEFLKEKYNQDKVSYLYQAGVNYDEMLEECKAFHKEKKKNKLVSDGIVGDANPNAKANNDFKSFGASLDEPKVGEVAEKEVAREKPEPTLTEVDVAKPAPIAESPTSVDTSSPLLGDTPVVEDTYLSEEEVESLEERGASAQTLDSAFKVLNNASLSDLPEDAHLKLKKSFFEKEVERILSGNPSVEDDNVFVPIVVHKPIDDAKMRTLGYIIESCPGSGKVKFYTADKEELHEGWLDCDVIKATVMSKIYNL